MLFAVDMLFGIGYNDDIGKTRQGLARLVAEYSLVLDDPAATIRVHEAADYLVIFICRRWTQTEHCGEVYWVLTRLVKEHFEAEDVSTPFPQQDLQLYSTSRGRGAGWPPAFAGMASVRCPGSARDQAGIDPAGLQQGFM